MSTVWTANTLADALSALTVESLKPLARRCVASPPTRKAELIQVIAQALQSSDFIAAQLRQADSTTLLALSEAAYNGGLLNEARFAAKYGTKFTVPSHSTYSYYYGRSENLDSVAALFFYVDRIPSDLVPRLKALLPAPRPFVVPSSDDLPETVEGKWHHQLALSPFLTEEAALHDLLATLTLIGQGKVSIGEATHQPTAAATRLLRDRFLLPDVLTVEDGARLGDAIRPFGLTMIVQAAGLAKPSGTKLVLTKAGQAALEESSPHLLKRCWEAWLAWDKLDELSRVRGIKGQKARGQRLTPPSERKAQIAQALAACPSGQWIGIQDFFRHARASKYDFAVETGEYSRFYVGYSMEYGWLGYAGTDLWSVVNAAYIRVILLEYAATLGLIDVATIPAEDARLDFTLDFDVEDDEFSRYGGLCYLRISRLGSYILEQTDTYAGPVSRQEQSILTVLPSLDVVVADRSGLTPNDRALLDRFTSRVSDDVSKLSKERLLDAVESGLTISNVEEFLRRRSQQDLPQTARVLLEDAARGAAAIQRATPAFLIACADAHIAQLISHDGVLGKLCLLAGDDHVVVRDGQLAAFRRGLRRLGFVLADEALRPRDRETAAAPRVHRKGRG